MATKIKLTAKDFEFLKEKLKSASKLVKKQDFKEIGQETVAEMKTMISKGISPVRGGGRFPGYKNPEKYPKRVKSKYPAKKDRPVNLKLTGEQLDNLRSESTDKSFTIKYTGEAADKEQGHREGVHGQPIRPTIPEENEQFAVSIERNIVKKLTEIITKRFK